MRGIGKGYGRKDCEKCGVVDDENHRINHCETWGSMNLSNSCEKVDYQMLYSEDRGESMVVIDKILSLWDLGNGRNRMRAAEL